MCQVPAVLIGGIQRLLASHAHSDECNRCHVVQVVPAYTAALVAPVGARPTTTTSRKCQGIGGRQKARDARDLLGRFVHAASADETSVQYSYLPGQV